MTRRGAIERRGRVSHATRHGAPGQVDHALQEIKKPGGQNTRDTLLQHRRLHYTEGAAHTHGKQDRAHWAGIPSDAARRPVPGVGGRRVNQAPLRQCPGRQVQRVVADQ
eukprot:5188658-Pyramimonas_sp.AAC.1